MDGIDYEILEILSQNGRAPIRRISETVHLSAQAVAARIARLEEQGIIDGYQAVINPEKAGNLISAIITLSIKSLLQADFTQFAREQSCVAECHHVTGIHSMVVMVHVPSIAQLDAFVTKAQKFGNTQTLLVLSSPIRRRFRSQNRT